MKKNILVIIVLFTGILCSCYHKQPEKMLSVSADTIPVKISNLVKKDVTIPVYASGQFLTDDETVLSFKTGGIVEDIFVREGDCVKKGQVLATLNLTEIKALELQAELSYEKAKRDLERVKNLYNDSVATLEQYQNCKTAFDVANESLSSVKFNMSYSRIIAMNDGYVLKKYVNPGQFVGAGNPVIQCNGAGSRFWKFRAGLSDREWSAVAIHDLAEISTDASPQTKIKGVVAGKSKEADPYTGTFFVEIDITDQPDFIASGLYGKAIITSQKKIPVWTVPYEAVLEGNERNGYAYITNDLKKAIKIKISILHLGKDEIYVDKGFENASNLIVSGGAYLSDGSLIKVYK
jgi:RND family efflux transporter MFP subunit